MATQRLNDAEKNMKHAPSLLTFRFDTAENEPSKLAYVGIVMKNAATLEG